MDHERPSDQDLCAGFAGLCAPATAWSLLLGIAAAVFVLLLR
jgi:hypothetical protein